MPVPGLVASADAAFRHSRKPLVCEFIAQGRRVVVINVHLSSKRGGSPLFGSTQPPLNGGVRERALQTTRIRGFVERLATRRPV